VVVVAVNRVTTMNPPIGLIIGDLFIAGTLFAVAFMLFSMG